MVPDCICSGSGRCCCYSSPSLLYFFPCIFISSAYLNVFHLLSYIIKIFFLFFIFLLLKRFSVVHSLSIRPGSLGYVIAHIRIHKIRNNNFKSERNEAIIELRACVAWLSKCCPYFYVFFLFFHFHR